jgi:3-phenylpropionate/trans-cinnamate dioxygenase ferredoxin component
MTTNARSTESSGEFTPVATTADINPGALRSVRLPTGEQVVVMNVDGDIYALEDSCSHEAYALSAGDLLPDGTIECVWHGARFDCRTGAACHPPAIDGVSTYAVRVVDGTILIGPRLPRGR